MYCKSNARRVINYTQNEPINKYDLWLSENARYNEDGLLEYDNAGQPACDLILKIYRQGQWKPIVGYNTTAANKINTLPNNEGHPAIFTGDNPDTLKDAGTMADVLINYLDYNDWLTIINEGGLGDSITYLITDGDINLPYAASGTKGCVWADTFNATTHPNADASDNPMIALVKYKANHGTNDYNLYVHAKDLTETIHNYFIENPSDPNNFILQLANSDNLGGINAQTGDTSQDYRGVPVLLGGPVVGLTYGGECPSGFTLYQDYQQYNPNSSFLYVPAWALMDVIHNPTGDDTPEPMIRNGFGIYTRWERDLHSGLDYCTVSLQCTPNTDKGKYLRIKSDGSDIEWVTIPEGTNYLAGVGIDITNDTIGIDISGGASGNILAINQLGDNVEWIQAPSSGTDYTEGVGIDITNDKISSEISINSNALSASSSLGFNCVLGTIDNPIGNVTVSVDLNTPVVLAPFSYTKINLDTNGGSGNVSFIVFNQKDIMNGDPVFIELILGDSGTIGVSIADNNLNGCGYIDSNGVLQGNSFKERHVLVTIQFGIVKFEAIKTYSAIE